MLSPEEIQKVCELVEAAGRKLKGFSKDPEYLKTVKKPDGSPVTRADLEVSDFLTKGLEPLGYTVVSEEGRLHEGCETPYFLVDPLDGTKHFARGDKDYAVLVGFVVGQRPVFGCIASPEEGKLYWAQAGQGCFLNGERLTRGRPKSPIVAYSSGFHKNKIRQWVMDAFSIGDIRTRGSALKFSDIAEGKVDIFPRFGPTGEWDTAAAQVILEETDCALIDMYSGEPVTYGKPKRLNRGIIACHRDLLEKSRSALKEFFQNKI